VITTRKRGNLYHVDYVSGPVRLRGPLGTSDPKSAKRLATRISFAMSDGPRSQAWIDLEPSLPPQTWKRFSGHVGVDVRPLGTWGDLLSIYWKEHIKGWAKSTARAYDRYLKTFEESLPNAASTPLTYITKSVMEKYRSRRETETASKPQYRNGAALEKEMDLLRGVFSFAKEENMVGANPVKKVKSTAERSVTQPFTDEDMDRMTACATDKEQFAITLLRWTGLRGSDAVDLKWSEVNFNSEEIRRTMLKTGKEVVIPVQAYLVRWLMREKMDEGFVLDGVASTRTQLYNLVRALGDRAKVPGCRPHRFRDTLAVTILLRGGTMYDVAKMLGITTAVAEKHYTPFVPELRSRLRGLLEEK
jgi:integrase